MTCSVTYLLKGHGWAECTIQTDEAIAHLLASHLHDSLDDLLRATVSVVHGARDARALFIDEPGEYRLLMDRIENDTVRLRVIAFDQSFSRSKDDDGRMVFSSECRLRTFAGAVLSAAQRLLQDHGTDGYRQHWNHEFPKDGADHLKEALRSTRMGQEAS